MQSESNALLSFYVFSSPFNTAYFIQAIPSRMIQALIFFHCISQRFWWRSKIDTDHSKDKTSARPPASRGLPHNILNLISIPNFASLLALENTGPDIWGAHQFFELTLHNYSVDGSTALVLYREKAEHLILHDRLFYNL